jgi:uncharacterized protein (TIGR04255 family)
MPFKESSRVIYERNPLVNVICQLRFPRILKIGETMPVDFQEGVRTEYPDFSIINEQQQQFTFDIQAPNASPVSVSSGVQSEIIKNYKFSSSDGNWTVNLTSTFLSLSTLKYSKWEEFSEKLYSLIQLLDLCYDISYFERIGLRYIDEIKKAEYGLTENCWEDLIHGFALGFLSNSDICDEIKAYENVAELDLGEGITGRILTALGQSNASMVSATPLTVEKNFIVDSDLFVFKTLKDDAKNKLESMHKHSTNIIRAIFTDKLHNSLLPRDVE